MAIKVKAVERNVSFQEGVEKYAYVLQPDLYNKLSASKVIQEASLRSGIIKGALNAAWDAIGEVIKAWATEGHSVAVPGLGTMRFGIRSTSVEDVNKVASSLITSRRVIFTPSTDIKEELKKTAVSITCYDRKGEIVKRVTSTDDSEVEDPDNEGNQKYSVTVASANTSMGSATGGATGLQKGTVVTITATPLSGYRFTQWSDGNTQNPRSLVVDSNVSLTAQFASTGGNGGGFGA